MDRTDNQNWHALEHDEALAMTQARRDGLDPEEARQRLDRHGANVLPTPRRRRALQRFADQFTNPLVGLLVVAASVTVILGHYVDAVVIAAVVIINALVGYIQEGKAERALAAIGSMLTFRAHVLRNGRATDVDASEVVSGDIVRLRPGDRVPADIRLLGVHNLQVDESMLTGESMAVVKVSTADPPTATVGDRLSMAHAGTLVRAGHGDGVVVATGERTELGRISTMLLNLHALKTPLLEAIERFARLLSAVILGSTATLYLFGTVIRDYATTEMFVAAVAFAVAAIPEGLPAIITIALALGVQAMARRNAIVRRLPAVEALGAVTIICSDKTGTLTRNEMRVSDVLVAGDDARMLRYMVLCNDAGTAGDGDPTELALLHHAAEQGIDADDLRYEFPRIDQVPFASEHRYMVTVHEGFSILKGAPEVVFARCVDLDTAAWDVKVAALARRGRRTLAFAGRRDNTEFNANHGWTLTGIVGLVDPPREEAVKSVAACHAAGIGVKMVTGDHALTAAAIGLELGIGDGNRVLTGAELDLMTDTEFTRQAIETDVFARVSPVHKLKLVEALQSAGEVVAMTGDGVNDAPALKRASVGVAMGRKGTDVARESAEIVLADDNFASITAAIAEGRRIYDNIIKAILFILPTSAGEALTIGAAVTLGWALPLTPVQVLWVNMATAVTLALALVFEPGEDKLMQRPPRPPDQPLLSPLLVHRTLFVSVLMLAATFGLFVMERAAGAPLDAARTVAVNALVMCEIAYLLNVRYLTGALTPFNAFRGNPWVLPAIIAALSLQLALTYWAPLQSLFGTTAIGPGEWLRVISAGIALLLLVELEKAVRRRLDTKGTG